jgi:serine protein kinase
MPKTPLNALAERAKTSYQSSQVEEFTLNEYLELAKVDPSVYASPAERMIAAIGKPELIDTSKDEKLARIFSNRVVKQYEGFKDFYGVEEVIERIVSYFTHSAQGLEESKQVLFLLGPVGCLSGDTEVLTPTGWKRFDTLLNGETILQYSKDNNEASWTTSELLKYPAKTLTHVFGQQIDQVLSDEHRVLYRHDYTNELEVKPFSVIKDIHSTLKTGFRGFVPSTFDLNNDGLNLTDDEIRLIVAIQADSHVQDGRVDFSLKHGYKIDRLTALLESVGIPYVRAARVGSKEGFTRIKFKWEHATKSFNNFYTANSAQLRVFSSESMRWDGDTIRGRYNTTVLDNAKFIQFAFNASGVRSTIREYLQPGLGISGKNHSKVYTVYGVENNEPSYRETEFVEVPASDGFKYCVSVPSTFFVARRGAHIFITGNSSKSSIAERLKELFESQPFYSLKGSPTHDDPLALFHSRADKEWLSAEYGIPVRYTQNILSPWAVKRLTEFEGDITKFTVIKQYPNQLKQIALARTEPADDNTQDVTTLVGKVDIRKLEKLSQHDPDAYSYSGALSIGNRGILEFVEMYKSPIKVLNPLLTATQERKFVGSEAIGALPFDGIVLSHSNISEYENFKNNRNNEAFMDRIYVVKVPYNLRVSEEENIYRKMLKNSSLSEAPTAPGTLEMLARFAVLSRLKEHDNSNLFTKMEIYDGKTLKATDPSAKSLTEYKDAAGPDEGMDGFSTRSAFKVLSQVYNYDPSEISASPVHLMMILRNDIVKAGYPEEIENAALSIINDVLAAKYLKFIEKEFQQAFLESYGDYGQSMFDRYIMLSDAWIQDSDFRDPNTGEIFDRQILNDELSKIEKPAGISNPKDFRSEVVNFVLRAKAANKGRTVSWTSYQKLRDVIEKNMFAATSDLLPVISFSAKANAADQKKHANFIDRMIARGYTAKQVRLLVDWYSRSSRSN